MFFVKHERPVLKCACVRMCVCFSWWFLNIRSMVCSVWCSCVLVSGSHLVSTSPCSSTTCGGKQYSLFDCVSVRLCYCWSGIVLLYYWITVWQCYCVTGWVCNCAIRWLFYCATLLLSNLQLLYHCVTWLLLWYSLNELLCYYATLLPVDCEIVFLCFCVTVLLCDCVTVWLELYWNLCVEFVQVFPPTSWRLWGDVRPRQCNECRYS